MIKHYLVIYIFEGYFQPIKEHNSALKKSNTDEDIRDT